MYFNDHNINNISIFPYTTLFRSTTASSVASDPSCMNGLRRVISRRPGALKAGCILMTPAFKTPSLREEDRKSTRLNSSHRSISYSDHFSKKKILTSEISRNLHD